MGLELDSDHKYRLDGRRVPGFSEICRDLGITGDTRFFTEAGREEGTALHDWCHFIAQGQEPDAEPDPRIAPRVAQFRKFLVDTGFQFVGGEENFYHPTLQYCGRPDLFGTIGPRKVLIDIKGGAKLKWHPLQLVAYKLLLATTFPVQDCYALYLDDDGYKLEMYQTAQHEHRWRAIVGAYHAKAFYTKERE